MLKKTLVRKTDKTSVVFEIAGFDDASQMSIAGEFNDWQPKKTPMKRRKDGAWAATVRLLNGNRFEYCVVVDGQRWVADERATER